MTRVLAFLILILSLPGMGKPPTPVRLPLACELLVSVDIAGTMGSETVLELNVMRDGDDGRLSLCTVNAGPDATGLSLLLRDMPDDTAPNTERARDVYVEGLVGEMQLDPEGIEQVALGAASVWIEEVGQLTVWMRGGQIMMIFTVRPSSARPLAEDVAAKVIAAYP